MRRVSRSAAAATTRSSTVLRYLGAITGGVRASLSAIVTLPREVGRRLQTDAVNALNGCSGSPKRSSDSGCTWYSRSGRDTCALLVAKQPSWLGLIDSGPERVNRYCSAMPALATQLCDSVFSVVTPLTSNTMRNCKWSCRLAPTPESA